MTLTLDTVFLHFTVGLLVTAVTHVRTDSPSPGAQECIDLDYCSSLRPDECYYNYKWCCQTCDRYRTGRQDCEFGDRASICSKEICYLEENWVVCCQTCSEEIRNSTTSTTSPDVSTGVTYLTTETSGELTTQSTLTTRVVTSLATTSSDFDQSTPSDCVDGNVGDLTCADYLNKVGSSECYSLADVCCETCTRFKDSNSSSDCLFGDHAPWCRGLESQKCYHEAPTCCRTCSEVNKRQEGTDCLYGDRASRLCSTLIPRECYKYQDICCETCHNFSKGFQHLDYCKFGDRLEKKICDQHTTAATCIDDPDLQQNCCQTCAEKL